MIVQNLNALYFIYFDLHLDIYLFRTSSSRTKVRHRKSILAAGAGMVKLRSWSRHFFISLCSMINTSCSVFFNTETILGTGYPADVSQNTTSRTLFSAFSRIPDLLDIRTEFYIRPDISTA